MGVYRTTEEWRAIIEEQRHSGLNQTQFCRLHAITRSAFFNARQRLYLNNEKLTAFIPARPSTATTTPVTDAEPVHMSTTSLPPVAKSLPPRGSLSNYLTAFCGSSPIFPRVAWRRFSVRWRHEDVCRRASHLPLSGPC